MGSICLSSAPILRCTSFTRGQNLAFFVPPVVEILFSSSLIFFNWGSGRYGLSVYVLSKLMKTRRRHLLLTADGWVYLLLALMELLSQILPAVREDLSLFRTFDVGIGEYPFSAKPLVLNLSPRRRIIPSAFLLHLLPLFIRKERTYGNPPGQHTKCQQTHSHCYRPSFGYHERNFIVHRGHYP